WERCCGGRESRGVVGGRPGGGRGGAPGRGAGPGGRPRLYGVVVDGDAASGATARCTVVAWGCASRPVGDRHAAGAVADRFGLWGVYGQPNVSWGNYARFVDYTAKLNCRRQ